MLCKKGDRCEYRHPDSNASADQTSETTNAERSPLLRLPPEIRNHIFDLVFDGCNLHFTTRTGNIKPRLHSICWSPAGNFSKFQRYHDAHGFNCEPGKDDLQDCYTDLRSPELIFWPTRACRQIYREMALLPFARSVIHFSGFRALTEFMTTRGGRRLGAIEAIVLQEGASHAITDYMVGRLVKLKYLSVMIPYRIAKENPVDSLIRSVEFYYRNNIIGSFVQAPLEGVEFSLDCYTQGPTLGTQDAAILVRHFRAWASSKQDSLLRTPELWINQKAQDGVLKMQKRASKLQERASRDCAASDRKRLRRARLRLRLL